MSEVKDSPMTGCLVDGHWGQYAVARVVQIAADYGYEDHRAEKLAARHLANMGGGSLGGHVPLTDGDFEYLNESATDAESWLNANIAQQGHYFTWEDGEFYYTVEDDDRVEDPWH